MTRDLFFDTDCLSAFLWINNTSILIEGSHGKQGIGRGEAASIALAKTYNGILASNNYSDIAIYIEEYGLQHIDTGKILLEALERSIITESEGNLIWQSMLNRKRRLPAADFTTYLNES